MLWDACGVTSVYLAHLRRARRLRDREYARPLDVRVLARLADDASALLLLVPDRYGETPDG